MPQSSRWKALRLEVDSLRLHFLPDPFDPVADYSASDRIQSLTRAFLVLCHAEVETYLEDSAKDLLGACDKVWRKSKRIPSPLAFALAIYCIRSGGDKRGGKKISVPDKVNASRTVDAPDALDSQLQSALTDMHSRVKRNHGVKEANVLNLFYPLGTPFSAFGSTLLPNLNSFGALRGEHAHKSQRSVRSALDPETEYKRVVNLVEDLRSLDSWLANARRRIR
jgi:hypothetical protein